MYPYDCLGTCHNYSIIMTDFLMPETQPAITIIILNIHPSYF